jgi:hypothetical protein
VSDASPDPALPAAAHPATRAWLRRWLGSGAALTILGAVLLTITAQRFQAEVDAAEPSPDPTASWLGAFGLIGVGFGLPFLVLTSMLWRRLRRDPWREVVTGVDSATAWWSSIPSYTVTVDGVRVRIVGGMWVVQGPVFEAGDQVTLWVAGPVSGRSIPVAPRGGRSVFRGVARRDA